MEKTAHVTQDPAPPPARLRLARRAYNRLKKCATCWGRGIIRLVPQKRDANGKRLPIRRADFPEGKLQATAFARCGCLG